ncbi:hypothetical protein CEG14_06930 [Bordetella genomosp. 1]|uniref:Uncharacterized protein n=1 Tax=Bordetella genomosp. 1 TaxID=1395607 RepID=A0A261SQ98_9BORD|nr:hypothetical protein [Bordetella genomosp. 1]OZI39251.1 hypothetical protein CEG14_06930 [Bordetella genomosp. 1]OZI65469.1 hypothetical protein CAL27_10580 [Bordetella genomosp. 1]
MSVGGSRTLAVLRVPVHQPAGVRLLRGLAAGWGAGMAGAGAALALGWRLAPVLLGSAVLAAAGLWAGCRRRPAAARAVAVALDPDRCQVRRRAHWQRAALRHAHLAPRHVRLDLELDATAGCVTNSKITCTVWRSGVSSEQWRRLRVTARAAGRIAVSRRGAS